MSDAYGPVPTTNALCADEEKKPTYMEMEELIDECEYQVGLLTQLVADLHGAAVPQPPAESTRGTMTFVGFLNDAPSRLNEIGAKINNITCELRDLLL
jgi:hypothetical protein